MCKGLPTQALIAFPTVKALQAAVSALSCLCLNCLGRLSTGTLRGVTGSLSAVLPWRKG